MHATRPVTAAWISLVAPLLAAAASCLVAYLGTGTIPTPMLWVGLAGGAVGLAAAAVSFFGIKPAGPWRVLPLAVPGLLISLAVLALAALFLLLTGLPGP